MEVWLHAFAIPGQVADTARRAEAWGFDGLLIADSQNLTADIWVELALAGAATSRLRVGPGVTNPVTRHLAVTAGAAATLQAETAGRATLGFARGDSALSQVGLRPETAGEFERSLQRLQGLLRGERVQLSEGSSQIRWLAATPGVKVPVHVAASGPRVIAAAARHAEGVDLTVGAELERIRWGLRLVGDAATGGAGAVSVGAYINVAVDPDRDRARGLVRGSVSTFARFSSAPASADRLSATARGGVAQAARGYRAERHGEAAAAGAQALDAGFIDRFAVAGAPDEVAGRLAEMATAGVQRLIVVPCSLDSPHADVLASNERFAREVLPALRAGGRD
jgi:5,10-methylenetetrahydromethanopterin reductase